MKTEDEILKDLYGKKLPSGRFASYSDIKQLMRLFADQFRYVKTTCGKEILFDDCDYDLLRSHVLFFDKQREMVLTVIKSRTGKKTAGPAAKLILNITGKAIIHYKDKNSLNLKRDNLEVINTQIRHFGEKKAKNNTSGYKGVSFKKHAKKYEAYIKLDDSKKHLGYFSNAIDAAREYNKAAIEYFGENYALLNNI